MLLWTGSTMLFRMARRTLRLKKRAALGKELRPTLRHWCGRGDATGPCQHRAGHQGHGSAAHSLL